jgi:hypothetical protein
LDDSLIGKVNWSNASHSEAETSEESAVDSVDQQLTKVNQGNLTEEAIAPSPTEPNASLEAEVAQPKETAEALKVGVKRSYSVGDRVHWTTALLTVSSSPRLKSQALMATTQSLT